VSSSIVQPLVGYLADKRPLPWLIPAGVVLACAGTALTGIAPTYATIALCAALAGIGVAAFHPEAARYANYVAGDRKAAGMRWFALGGNVGFALGPLVATPILLAFGTPGTLAMLVPCLGIGALYLRELPRLRAFAPAGPKAAAAATLPDRWGPFSRLTAYIIIRSMAYFGLVTFLPLFAIGVFHATKTEANTLLTLYLIAGAFGTIAGGRWADRFGRRAVLIGSTSSGAVLLGATTLLSSQTHLFLAFAAGALAVGFALVASQTAMVVLGQEYLPRHLGVASGVTLGLAISLGGAFTPVLGALADHQGLVASFYAIVACLGASTLISCTLPRSERGPAGLQLRPTGGLTPP
jgi:FSR family fosmidomycin resistance protein-like MFS transporter